jgi:integrase
MMTLKLDFKTVQNLKSAGRYTDALVKGLQLWVKPNYRKYWIFRFSHNKRSHDLSLGSFPALSIAQARIEAQKVRDQLEMGINPALARKAEKAPKQEKVFFKEFALDCLEKKKPEWSNQKHAAQWLYTLEKFAFPVIGNKALDEIDTDHILTILEPIWSTKTETASRLRGRLEWILASATTRKLRNGVNPALWRGHLQTILSAPSKLVEVKHHKAMDFNNLPSFIEELRQQDYMSALALEFLILNASRTGEVIGGLRSEVKDCLWVIPANRMKAKKEHRVPLCDRSIEILGVAKAMDEESIYLFSKNGKPLTNMAMPMMLRRLKQDVTVHGFRSTFRDWVSELTDHSPEVAEMALAHRIRNEVEAAYRRGDLLERRRKLMNDWESYCNNRDASNAVTLMAA